MGKHYDATRKEFKVRQAKKGIVIRRSLSQLSQDFNVILTNERDARPFWNQYRKQEEQRLTLQSISNVREKLMEALERLQTIPVASIGESPKQHYLTITDVAPIQQDNNQGDIDNEIAEFCKHYSKDYKSALTHFRQVTGKLNLAAYTKEHYSTWITWIGQNVTTSKVTAENLKRRVKTFLLHVSTSNNYAMGFLQNKKLNKITFSTTIEEKDNHVYWTIDQIRQAFAGSADLPLARFSLLMGLNCGSYDCDLADGYFSKSKVVDGYLTTGRKKNLRDGVQHGKIQTYKLWVETIDAINALPDGSLTKRQINYQFRLLRERFDLPAQKFLRKTSTQMIYDAFGESGDYLSRLFRNEGEIDCHNKSYVTSNSKPTIEKLSEATDFLRQKLDLTA